MGKYPVTQAQWKTVAGWSKVNRDLKLAPSKFQGENRPVEQVSWYEAREFCDRLSAKTNFTFRLPSEAEWEYACRAGTTTPFSFGTELTPEMANFGKHFKGMTEVGRLPTNAFGLYDTHGNVWEWCADVWHKNYEGAPPGGTPWIKGKDKGRVLRGGSWIGDPWDCCSAYREGYYPEGRGYNMGFRVACSPA
ncbi:MAG: formylglycine-generating enzyme family protein [Synechococcus sp.]